MDEFRKYLTNQISRAETAIQELKLGLENNPYHALEWSRPAFEAAGILHVYKETLRDIDIKREQPLTMAKIETWLIDSLVRAANSGGFSTSPTANLAQHYRMAAMAKLLDAIDLNRFDE